MTEAEMVSRCRTGDREAQGELYARTSSRIYGVLRRVTGSAEVAFDLSQDTYLRAFTRIDQFTGRSSISTWLYRIAVTEALQYLRSEKGHRAKLEKVHTSRVVSEGGDSHMLRLDLAEALLGLDATDRILLSLRYQDGFDYRTIGEIMDCAEGTVASGLNRARGRLRKKLASAYGNTEEGAGGGHPIDCHRNVPEPREP